MKFFLPFLILIGLVRTHILPAQMAEPTADPWAMHAVGLTYAPHCPDFALQLFEASAPKLCLPAGDWEIMIGLAKTAGRDTLAQAWNKQWIGQQTGHSPAAQAMIDSLYRESERVNQPSYLKAADWIVKHQRDGKWAGKDAQKHFEILAEKQRVDATIIHRISLYNSLHGFPGADALGMDHYAKLTVLMDRISLEDWYYWVNMIDVAFHNHQIFPIDYARFCDRFPRLTDNPYYVKAGFGTEFSEIVPRQDLWGFIDYNRLTIGLPALYGDGIRYLDDYLFLWDFIPGWQIPEDCPY